MDSKEQPVSKDNCTGCGMCSIICPKNAIEMRPDEAGFLYPERIVSKCIQCGLCEKRCPSNQELRQKENTEAYLAKAKPQTICMDSSSGGMYTVLSDAILHSSGIVYAPDFDTHMSIRHMRISNEERRDHSRGSKYVQSSMMEVYATIIEDLELHRVIFFGTPCQTAAIKAYVPEDKKQNLYLVDVICNGVGSPYIWKLHTERIEKKYGRRLERYIFRPKVDGYLSKAEVACFDDGSVRIIDNGIWKYNPVYYSGKIMRPVCGNCKYASMKRVSDISIGDCAKATSMYPCFDTSMGASTLLINTEKGRELLHEIEEHIDKLELEDLSDHARLKNPCSVNSDLDCFVQDCKNRGMTMVISRGSTMIQKGKIHVMALIIKLRRCIRAI